jgi:hypothetical protein
MNFLRRIILKVFVTGENPLQLSEQVLTVDSGAGFRISFDVQKNITSDPNTATIQVYNLKPDTRNALSSRGKWVELYAGYQDDIKLVYAGQISAFSIRKGGEDLVSVIVCKTDWDFRKKIYRNAFIENTNLKSIMIDILKTFKIPYSPQHILVNGDAGERGWGFSDNIQNIFDNLANWFNFSWSMQDYGFLAIDDKMLLPTNINLESHILDVSAIPKEDDRTSVGYELNCVLNAGFQVGYNVVFSSQYYPKNDFKIYRLSHSGDSHDNQWTTSLMGYKAGSLVIKPKPGYFEEESQT